MRRTILAPKHFTELFVYVCVCLCNCHILNSYSYCYAIHLFFYSKTGLIVNAQYKTMQKMYGLTLSKLCYFYAKYMGVKC